MQLLFIVFKTILLKEPVRFLGQVFCYYIAMKKEVILMKGYYTANGFYGLVGNSYLLFSDESDYYDFMDQDGDAA